MTEKVPDGKEDSDEEESTEQILKLVVCGDGASGKTSLCTRFAHDQFARQYQQTVGLDFFSRRLLLPANSSVLLQIWDVGGQSIASPMLEKYLFGAHGAIVVYDVTNRSSFENLDDWVSVIKKLTRNQQKIQFALVGNKTDLEHRRAVRIERHMKFAEQHGMTSHYVSAKTGDSVVLMFRQVTAEILGLQLSKTEVEAETIVVEAPVTTQSEAELKNIRHQRRTDLSRNTAVCRVM
ncbi:hypothetical protein AB6A40_003283 [Gnathostoma spinigerum]|uniref:Ras-related protein Rab-28 n=1 Tax=Gnathostoma spinigerum TaxID=75299 RepID=A0ABD6E955_9BILA